MDDERWLIDDVVNVWRNSGARWLILENVSAIRGGSSPATRIKCVCGWPNGRQGLPAPPPTEEEKQGDDSGLYAGLECPSCARDLSEGRMVHGSQSWLGAVQRAICDVAASAVWTTSRASHVGACHRRERWFCVVSADEPLTGLKSPAIYRNVQDGVPLLPTPTATQPGGTPEQHLERKRSGVMSRPNPTVTDLRMRIEHGNLSKGQWREFAPFIARHETVLGREVPEPMVDGELSPTFVEWMMMLPEGHVAGRTETGMHALKMLGNGVVPHQAAASVAAIAAQSEI